MPTYEDMFNKFIHIVESGNYQKFASVLSEPDRAVWYGKTLHEFLCKASNLTTRYDPIPDGEKFYDLLELAKTSYPETTD